jgi:hypothetical protein
VIVGLLLTTVKEGATLALERIIISPCGALRWSSAKIKRQTAADVSISKKIEAAAAI